MGPFYESKTDVEGKLVVETIEEGGCVTIGFATSEAEIFADADPASPGMYVILGRVTKGRVVDEHGCSRPVEEVVHANWRD